MRAPMRAPAPTVSASLNEIGEGTFSQNDGERVVLSFKLVSDSDDAQVSQLSIQASGDLDETNDVGSVKLYLDSNQDGSLSKGEFANLTSMITSGKLKV